MAEAGHRLCRLAVCAAVAMTIPAPVSGDDNTSVFVMPPVLQLQAANGLTNEDVLRIVARENLMLTPREVALIDAALREAEGSSDAIISSAVTGPHPTTTKHDLRLDALLYFSPSSWSLWLNGGHVTPASVPLEIRINAITPEYVEIVWLPDPSAPEDRRVFTLRPNQVYSLESDEVKDVAALAQIGPRAMARSW